VTLIELPRRRRAPRTFLEAPPGLHRRISRALDALGDLPEGFDLPGFDDLSQALITIADDLAGDPDLEDTADAEPETEL